MSTQKSSKVGHAVLAGCTGLLFAAAVQATPTLAPLIAGNAALGNSQVGTGLNGNWYKVDDQAHFSNYVYTDSVGVTAPIKSFGWGSGFWSTGDIAQFTSGPNANLIATTTSVSAVSFANSIYNDLYGTGLSGWDQDHARTLAPIVAASAGCSSLAGAAADCAQTNYAAVFTGYVYVAEAGAYDFGVFSDDGFAFSLLGAGGTRLSMGLETHAGGPGRDAYSLKTATGLGDLFLDPGYYGINLSYYNRLEAGVIDLGWTGAPDSWRTIEIGNLFPGNQVPEPTSLSLMALALFGFWATRKGRSARVAPACT